MTSLRALRGPVVATSTIVLLLAACDGGSSSTSSSGGATPDGGTFTPPPGTPPGTVPATLPTADAVAQGGDCAPSTGAGVDHDGDITADETWRASDGPHRIKNSVRILSTVTVEACAKVELGERSFITIGNTGMPGKLVANGTYDEASKKVYPVVFAPSDPSKKWAAIVVGDAASADLSVTALVGAANPDAAQSGGGALRVHGKNSTSAGTPPEVTKNVRARLLYVIGAGDLGVNLVSLAGFSDDSNTLVVKGAAARAVKVEQGAVGALPAPLVLEGNGKDEIEVDPRRLGVADHTFKNLGAPYHIDGPMYVQPHTDGLQTTMTVEPGVTLRFEVTSSSGLVIGSTNTRTGVLVAKGTADKPITFTSAKATPAPGDWVGVYVRYTPSTGNAIEHAILEYAGAESSTSGFGCGPKDNDATIIILNARPTEGWVKNSTIRSGGGNAGIVLGWDSDLAGPDFVSTNTFQGVPACRVSQWRNAAGQCPGGGVDPVCL